MTHAWFVPKTWVSIPLLGFSLRIFVGWSEEYGFAMLEVNKSKTILRFLNSDRKVSGWSGFRRFRHFDTILQKNKLSRLKRIPYVFSIWPIDSGPFGHLILCGHDNGSCGLNIVEISTCIIIISNIIIIIIIINYYYNIIYIWLYMLFFSSQKLPKAQLRHSGQLLFPHWILGSSQVLWDETLLENPNAQEVSWGQVSVTCHDLYVMIMYIFMYV